ncbi:hypothetical protein HNP71_002591 [Acidocella aromatica]|uniref:Uncharacterized protein n=1 Tax=Acidocella aromatica TaxID=1303579 RepID=A0A840VQD2_9PROT|nr:hypothetical protein [Acidocella aromatica]
MWAIPAACSKMNTLHRVQLSVQAVAVLREAEKLKRGVV